MSAHPVQTASNDWLAICPASAIPLLGARVVRTALGNVAIFRNQDDQVFAVQDACPHKGGPLSQGIVHGLTVTCPLHAWKIDLDCGEAIAPDQGCVARYPVQVRDQHVYLSLTPLPRTTET